MVTVQRLLELVDAHCDLVKRHRASGEQLLRALEVYDPADPTMIDALRVYGRCRKNLKESHAMLINAPKIRAHQLLEAKLERYKLP